MLINTIPTASSGAFLSPSRTEPDSKCLPKDSQWHVPSDTSAISHKRLSTTKTLDRPAARPQRDVSEIETLIYPQTCRSPNQPLFNPRLIIWPEQRSKPAEVNNKHKPYSSPEP